MSCANVYVMSFVDKLFKFDSSFMQSRFDSETVWIKVKFGRQLLL
jgi:hypothetical protein